MRASRHLAFACLLVAVLAACASTPPDRVAYSSIDQAVTAAQTALKAWNEGFYQPGVVKDPVLWNARRDKIAAQYVVFQTTARLAATLAQDVSQADTATKIASDAAADLISLIASLEK